MASEGRSGTDLATFIVGIIILGALAQVAYKQIVQVSAPAPTETSQTETVEATSTSTNTIEGELEVM